MRSDCAFFLWHLLENIFLGPGGDSNIEQERLAMKQKGHLPIAKQNTASKGHMESLKSY
jgi:hypothetical protein